MDIGSVATIVAFSAALVTWTTYGLWHNSYDIWLVSDIGKVASYIFFPGEADLHAIADAHRPGRNDDYTNHQPCIVCSKTVNLAAPPPANYVDKWPAPEPWGSQGKVCHDPLHYKPNRMAPIGSIVTNKRLFNEMQCQSNNPNEAPVTEGMIKYQFQLPKDCYAVKGVGGMPQSLGVPASQYILKRLFPLSNSLASAGVGDINNKMFSKNPYLQYYSYLNNSSQTMVTATNQAIWESNGPPFFRIPGFYEPVTSGDINPRARQSFIPPLMNYMNWKPLWDPQATTAANVLTSSIPPEDCIKEYVCPSQLTFWNTESSSFDPNKLNSMWYWFMDGTPAGIQNQESLLDYLYRIKYRAFQVIQYNGMRFISFEYIPGYSSVKKYSGDTPTPVLKPMSQWSEEDCSQYIQMFLDANTFKYNQVATAPAMKRLVDNKGRWIV